MTIQERIEARFNRTLDRLADTQELIDRYTESRMAPPEDIVLRYQELADRATRTAEYWGFDMPEVETPDIRLLLM